MSKQVENLLFETIWNQAVKLANEAGDKWVADHTKPAFVVKDGDRVVGTMLDVCGIVYTKITDRRTKFYKWLKENKKLRASETTFHVPHKYVMRQEMGLNEACEYAAVNYLQKVGITGLRVYANID